MSENMPHVFFLIRYDCDDATSNPDKADKLGQLKVSVAEVVQGRLRQGRLLEKSGNGKSKIHVTARETVDCRVNKTWLHSFCQFGSNAKASLCYDLL